MYLGLGEYQKSVNLFEKSLQLISHLQDDNLNYMRCECCVDLALSCFMMGDSQKGKNCLKEAGEYLTLSTVDSNQILSVFSKITNYLVFKKGYAFAEEILENFLQSMKEIDKDGVMEKELEQAKFVFYFSNKMYEKMF